ncbi:hypothetical protein [Nocardia sp. NPDC057455]|uniref:hypothetical protein n=1 Tax=Nocardia sp. NPDC057455 TaxID=3346138 RepID=UPI00366FA2C3
MSETDAKWTSTPGPAAHMVVAQPSGGALRVRRYRGTPALPGKAEIAVGDHLRVILPDLPTCEWLLEQLALAVEDWRRAVGADEPTGRHARPVPDPDSPYPDPAALQARARAEILAAELLVDDSADPVATAPMDMRAELEVI